MNLVSATSPGVRLHISIKDKQTDDFTEILRGTCKGYEVVEVDGLVFRRKRKALPISPTTSPKAKRLDSDRTVVAIPEGNPKEEAANPTPALAPAAADQGNPVMEALPPSSREDSEEALEEASDHLELDAASVAQATLQKLTESDSEAQKLLALCANIPEEGLEGCEEIVALLERSIDDALQEGSLICYKPPSPDLLPARLETERQQKLSSLHSQLAALRQEEVEWLALLEGGKDLSKRNMILSTMGSTAEADRSERVLVLEQLQKQSHTALSFQVEGLAMMISNVEQLLIKAENQCRLMQVEYHKEKFLKFPHIDSPARLINEIVKDRRY